MFDYRKEDEPTKGSNLLLNPTMPPIRIKHMGYVVSKEDDYALTLQQVVNCTYPHPDAPNDATVDKLEMRSIGTYKSVDRDFPIIYLFYNSQLNLERMVG